MPVIYSISSSLHEDVLNYYDDGSLDEPELPFEVEVIDDEENLAALYKKTSETLAAAPVGENVKLIVHAHGLEHESGDEEFGLIAIPDGHLIHPSEIIARINNGGKKFLVDVYSCFVGTRLERDDATLIAQYNAIPEGVAVILNAGHFATQIDTSNFEISKTREETNLAKLIAQKIIYSPETLKFLTKKNGEIKFFKHSSIRPTKKEDLSEENIRRFLEESVREFLNFYNREIEAIEVEALFTEYKSRLTKEAIEEYKAHAFDMEIAREKKDYVQIYMDSGMDLETTTISLKDIRDRDMIRFLIEGGVLPEYNSHNNNCQDHLRKAIAEGDREMIDLFLTGKKSCNFVVNEEGDTPLSMASEAGNTGSLLYLLSRGANPAFKSKVTETTTDPIDVAHSEEVRKILTDHIAAATAITTNAKAAVTSTDSAKLMPTSSIVFAEGTSTSTIAVAAGSGDAGVCGVKRGALESGVRSSPASEVTKAGIVEPSLGIKKPRMNNPGKY